MSVYRTIGPLVYERTHNRRPDCVNSAQLHGRMFSACFIFIYIFASPENLASHDFVSVEYSAVPLRTLIIPYTTEYEYQKYECRKHAHMTPHHQTNMF